MNKYVSTAERGHLLLLGAIIVSGAAAVENYSKVKNVDKEFLKYLKTMATFAQKALLVRMKHLDPSAIPSITEDTGSNEIVLKARSEAKVEVKRNDKENEVYPVKKDTLMDLVGITIETTCQTCDGTIGDKCRLKELMLELKIATPVSDPAPGYCPYKYIEMPDIKDLCPLEYGGSECRPSVNIMVVYPECPKTREGCQQRGNFQRYCGK